MSPEQLPEMAVPFISKNDTRFRKCASAAVGLALTLRLIATGDTQQSLSFSYQLSNNTVSNIISATCDGVYQCLNKNTRTLVKN